MTPNDKPLPAEISKQIKKEAKEYVKQFSTATSEVDWYNGATAWATWKVKFDELHAQAKNMSDALEDILKQQTYYDVIEIAANALQQWKGTGKEVELSCMVCGTRFMGTEPQMCCSGRDCGCMGMPIEPVVCSKECYEKGIPPQKGGSVVEIN